MFKKPLLTCAILAAMLFAATATPATCSARPWGRNSYRTKNSYRNYSYRGSVFSNPRQYPRSMRTSGLQQLGPVPALGGVRSLPGWGGER